MLSRNQEAELTATPTQYQPIPDYPGYRVGTDGSVWTCRQRVGLGDGGGSKFVEGGTWKRLKPFVCRGYEKVTLSNTSGQRKCLPVHRLVLLAFVGNPPSERHQGCHNNGVRYDNRPTNLRWGTPKENGQDKVSHGNSCRGERNVFHRLTEDEVVSIRKSIDGSTGRNRTRLTRSEAKKHSVSVNTIRAILRREIWRHIS